MRASGAESDPSPQPEWVDALGEELDRLRAEVIATRGEPDARYIRGIITSQRALEIAGRIALAFSLFPPAWVGGTLMLSTAKILENMELGHNILHGQWDWMGDPAIHSTTWEWDFLTPADAWKRTHNHQHHTWTNVVGRDRDLGYAILRMSPEQPWRPAHLAQPLINALLAPVFEWGIALYDLEPDVVLLRRPEPASPRRRRGETGGQVPAPTRQGLSALPRTRGAVGGSLPAGQPHRQHRAQHLVAHHHHVRPLPRRGPDLDFEHQ